MIQLINMRIDLFFNPQWESIGWQQYQFRVFTCLFDFVFGVQLNWAYLKKNDQLMIVSLTNVAPVSMLHKLG